MTQTDLAKAIFENANAIRAKFGTEELYPSHIAAAVAEFCRTTYIGLEFSIYGHPRFEEGRLRYLFAKVVKLSPYFSIRLSRNAKEGLGEEPFDAAACESLAASRGAQLLSADVVFLCALRELHPSYRANLKTEVTDGTIPAILQNVDENVYDYVIRNTEKICAELQKIAQEAKDIRDWKPAAKFTEPEALASMFFENIEKTASSHTVTLKFPKFFGTGDLKVSIYRAQGLYYIHDNGCALRHLRKQVKDPKRRERILKRVCSAGRLDRGRITGSFLYVEQFLYYLQDLVFVTHADLYYTKAQCQLCRKDKGYIYVNQDQAEPLDAAALLEELKKGISFCYDEDEGLYYWLSMRYPLSPTRCSFLMETLADGRIRISDARKGKLEGQILEQFYWDHDDVAPYGKFISRMAERFGGEFDGQDVYVTEKTGRFFQAMMKFFNLAVLLSEFGHDIDAPRRKPKG